MLFNFNPMPAVLLVALYFLTEGKTGPLNHIGRAFTI